MEQGQKCRQCGKWVPAEPDGDQSDLCEDCATVDIPVPADYQEPTVEIPVPLKYADKVWDLINQLDVIYGDKK
jgi:hypothetical protein